MSKKQNFLDQDSTDPKIIVTQVLLRHLSKTTATNSLRQFNMIENELWQTWMKQMTFEDIHGCLTAANAIIKENGHEMES